MQNFKVIVVPETPVFKEYPQNMISVAVTSKIDVREV
jgi:hypothetical protein